MLVIGSHVDEGLPMRPLLYCRRSGFGLRSRPALGGLVLLMFFGNASFADTPASELPSASLSRLVQAYFKGCRARGGDMDSSYVTYLCACSAAFTMSRFTVNQLADEATRDEIEKSPEFVNLVQVCSTAASHRND